MTGIDSESTRMKNFTGHKTIPWDIVYKTIDGPMSNLGAMISVLYPKDESQVQLWESTSPKLEDYLSNTSLRPQNRESCSLKYDIFTDGPM